MEDGKAGGVGWGVQGVQGSVADARRANTQPGRRVQLDKHEESTREARQPCVISEVPRVNSGDVNSD